MVSKKELLTLALLGIGGLGVASMVTDGGDGDGVKERVGGILGTYPGKAQGAIQGAVPTVYQFAAQPSVTFPKAPTFDISKFLRAASAPAAAPTDRAATGVSAEPKKYREAGVALGYEGYVTPTTPTPIAPPYIPGVTEFVGEAGVALGYEGYVTPTTPTPAKEAYWAREDRPAYGRAGKHGEGTDVYHAGRSKKEEAMVAKTHERLAA